MTRTSVIIPNYNGERLLGPCLEAVRAQTTPADQILVVDDGSRDDSTSLVETHFPEVRIIRLAENRGFPAAVNAGIQASDGELIVLLNNDAIAEPTWLGALVDAARIHPDHHAFACRMLTVDEPPRIDSTGLALTRGFGQLSIGDGERDGPEFDEEREVLGPCGGAALYRRSLFDVVGLFDEKLMLYWEDYDIALRAQVAGLRCLYVGAARVRHLGSATIGRSTPRGVYHYVRNWAPVLIRAVPPGLLLAQLPHYLWNRLKADLLFVARGRFLSCAMGHLAAATLVIRAMGLARQVGRTRRGDVAGRLRRFLDDGSRLRQRARAAQRESP